MDIDKGGPDTVLRQRVREKVEGTPVNRLLRDDVAAVGRERLDRVGDRRRAGGHGQRHAPALKGRHPLLQDILRGIGQAAVNISGIRETEAVRRVLTVVENVRGRLVNGHRTGIRGRIRLLLADVKL